MQHSKWLLVALAGLSTLAACGDSPEDADTGSPDAGASEGAAAAGSVMPDVVCMDLQEAQDTIQAQTELFFSDSRDATGQDRMQLVDRNWLVVGQTPAAGTPIGDDTVPMLDAVKIGERSCSAEADTDADTGSADASEGAAAAASVMPDVVCMDLQEAQDTIQAQTELFFSDSRDATGQDRMQLVDRNWLVVGQTPAAGTPIDDDTVPMLDAVKIGERSC